MDGLVNKCEWNCGLRATRPAPHGPWQHACSCFIEFGKLMTATGNAAGQGGLRSGASRPFRCVDDEILRSKGLFAHAQGFSEPLRRQLDENTRTSIVPTVSWRILAHGQAATIVQHKHEELLRRRRSSRLVQLLIYRTIDLGCFAPYPSCVLQCLQDIPAFRKAGPQCPFFS